MLLSDSSIRALTTAEGVEYPLIAPFDEERLTPNGYDLSVESIERLGVAERVDAELRMPVGGVLSISQRSLPNNSLLETRGHPMTGDDGFWALLPGYAYLARLVETISLPPDLAARHLPRSSMLRMGVIVYGAVWDAGYSGRGQVLIQNIGSAPVYIGTGTPICQIVFEALDTAAADTYNGNYQNEGKEGEQPPPNDPALPEPTEPEPTDPEPVDPLTLVEALGSPATVDGEATGPKAQRKAKTTTGAN